MNDSAEPIRNNAPNKSLINIDEALAQILAAVNSIAATEEVSLLNAYGRVLAKDYIAEIDVPPADNSAMDGYAVNVADVTQNTKYFISQRIPAGSTAQPLSAETVARIFTGGEIPSGADAVIIQENCEAEDDYVLFKNLVAAGENIRQRGQDIKAGNLLFSAGHLLRAQDVALLASVNIAHVTVIKKLRVAVLSTGNELAEPGNVLGPGQIYNSNRYLLAGLLQKLNCEYIDIGIVKDSLEDTVHALNQASVADLIISSGGVSVGDEDHVKSAVERLGRLELWKLNLKPGKPLAFGFINNTPFIGLPGNPVSAFVTFELLVKNLIYKLQGKEITAPQISYHAAQFSISKPRSRCEFFRARVNESGVEIFNQQSSGALSSVVWANCLVRIDEGKIIAEGEMVPVYLLDE